MKGRPRFLALLGMTVDWRSEAKCLSRGINCVLMCSTDLAERSALAQDRFELRIVVEHIRYSRMVTQTLLQIRDRASQSRLGKWIEEIKHHGLGREGEFSRIAANRFQGEALLRCASVLAEVI